MKDNLVTNVWNTVSERVGDDLRAVARYEATAFEARMRDDVRERYDTGELQAVIDDIVVSQLGGRDTEEALEAGRLRGLVRVLDEAWVLSWTDGRSRKSGLVVSIQRDGTTASMGDVEWCVRYLDDEVAPSLR